MDAILASLLIAACGGMSIIAYRHFDHYKTFTNVVTLVIIAVFATLVAYEYGLHDGARLSADALNHRLDLVFHTKVAVFLFVAYGAFLEYLPKLLKLAEKDRRKGE